MLLYVIMVVIIIGLIAKVSETNNDNLRLLSEQCRNEVYEEYKRKSTKFLEKELDDIRGNYYERLRYYTKRFDEDYGSECMTPFGFDKEKCEEGGKSYMRHNKNDMRLYHRYHVINEILDRRYKANQE